MSYFELNPHHRILLGPGPSILAPRVSRAMTTPVLGYMDPDYLHIMDEVVDLLRYLFQTKNELAFSISGTGMAGMEAAFANSVEEGDRVIVGVNGFFSGRMVEVASRYGARAEAIEVPWGEATEPALVAEALKKHPETKVVAVVHVETSTGVEQPLEEIGRLCQEHGALFIVDTVASLGGVNVEVDNWHIDICYSGSQKCIGAPPGLAPFTMSPKAREKLHNRKSKVPNWYLDVSLIEKYWTQERVYHHTGPAIMNYALREALRLVHEEGLQPRFERHRLNAEALRAGMEALGLSLFAKEGFRAASLNSISLSEGISDKVVRGHLLNDYNIEIAGGLGEVAGKIWRVGLMGEGARQQHVMYLLSALEVILKDLGHIEQVGPGVAAATRVYAGLDVAYGGEKPELAEAVKGASKGGRLSCHRAHQLAEDEGTPLSAIGRVANEEGIKISSCMLGCF